MKVSPTIAAWHHISQMLALGTPPVEPTEQPMPATSEIDALRIENEQLRARLRGLTGMCEP